MLTWLLTLALAADPSAADEALATGRAAQRAGDVQAALRAYGACLAEEPGRPACLWEQGWSYWTLGQWEAVVTAWEAVARADPAWPELDVWLPKARGHAAELERLRAAAAAAPAEVRAPVAEGRTLRLRAVGDVMLGADYPEPTLPPNDGANLLDPVAPLLRDADLTFANLEGPLCDGGETKKCKPDSEVCYAFRTPTRYGALLKSAGIDLASTANNHASDFGDDCRDQTHATLDALGIAWSGPPGTVGTREVDGLRVGLVAFHTSPSCNWVNDHERAAELVRLVAATHDWVVVSFHGGAEGASALHVPEGPETFYEEDRGDLRAFARAVIGAGASVVIGHGPHVPRGLEVVDGHLVAYSLGNFATYGRFNLSGHLGTSLVLEVTLAADGTVLSGRILPTKQTGKGLPKPDPDGTAIALIRELSEADFGAGAPVIAADGTFVAR